MAFDKQKWLDIAEIVDAFRVIPRAILALSGYLIWNVVTWFMELNDPSTQQAALVTVVVGIIPGIAGLYQSSGRKWNELQLDKKNSFYGTSSPQQTDYEYRRPFEMNDNARPMRTANNRNIPQNHDY